MGVYYFKWSTWVSHVSIFLNKPIQYTWLLPNDIFALVTVLFPPCNSIVLLFLWLSKCGGFSIGNYMYLLLTDIYITA